MEDLEKDVRLIRRQLAKGFISSDAVAKMNEGLPDVADKGEWLDPEADFGDDVADDDDDEDDDD